MNRIEVVLFSYLLNRPPPQSSSLKADVLNIAGRFDTGLPVHLKFGIGSSSVLNWLQCLVGAAVWSKKKETEDIVGLALSLPLLC